MIYLIILDGFYLILGEQVFFFAADCFFEKIIYMYSGCPEEINSSAAEMLSVFNDEELN
ncbi:MAG: hypothetical protein Q4F95_08180 [Oscillospiraceae bacterium]|nr:hypothetical protein [Oscillospiraceae bacterium]